MPEPKYPTPTMPIIADAINTIVSHVRPTYFAYLIFLGSSMPIKLTKICGWPKYPSPHPAASSKAFNKPSLGRRENEKFTSCALAIIVENPSREKYAHVGTKTIINNKNMH